MDLVAIARDLLNRLLGALAEQPYSRVAGLIEEVQRTVKPLVFEKEKQEEPDAPQRAEALGRDGTDPDGSRARK